MTRPCRDDDTPVTPEPEATPSDPGELDQAYQDGMDALRAAEAEQTCFRKWESAGSRRIEAYAALIRELMHMLSSDGELWKSAMISNQVQREARLTLVAVLRDTRRLAGFTGPRQVSSTPTEDA